MTETKRPLKVFPSIAKHSGHRLCHAHIIPLWDADRDSVRALYARLTKDGVDRYAWLDKEKLLPGQGFDTVNIPDWELEIRKAVCEADRVKK